MAVLVLLYPLVSRLTFLVQFECVTRVKASLPVCPLAPWGKNTNWPRQQVKSPNMILDDLHSEKHFTVCILSATVYAWRDLTVCLVKLVLHSFLGRKMIYWVTLVRHPVLDLSVFTSYCRTFMLAARCTFTQPSPMDAMMGLFIPWLLCVFVLLEWVL